MAELKLTSGQDFLVSLDDIIEDTDEEELMKLYSAIKTLEILDKEAGHLVKYYPDDGMYSRHNYKKQLIFMALGKDFTERLLLGGNRTGKTFTGAYEVACHVTGMYPDWWEGRVFNHPVDFWACGDTAQTTRDIVQSELLGPPEALGTGMIAKSLIKGRPKSKPGVPGGIESCLIEHVPTGGVSRISFKSYDQKRRAFQGTAKHGIWLDEEPPLDIYNECSMRTMTTQGLMIMTLTPLEGLTQFIKSFINEITTVTDQRESE